MWIVLIYSRWFLTAGSMRLLAVLAAFSTSPCPLRADILGANAGFVTSLSFTSDSRFAASGDTKGEAMVWRIADRFTWRALWRDSHGDRVNSVAFQPLLVLDHVPQRPRLLATASDDKTVRIWEVDSSRVRAKLQFPASVKSVAYSPDGKKLAVGLGDGWIEVIDLPSFQLDWQEKHSRDGVVMSVNSIAFSPDAKQLISGAGVVGDLQAKGEVKIWDVSEGELIKSKSNAGERRFGNVYSVAFSPDGKLVSFGAYAAVDDENQHSLWVWEWGGDPESENELYGRVHRIVNSYETRSVAFGPGEKLVTGGSDGFVKIWRIERDNGGRIKRMVLIKGKTFEQNGRAEVWTVAYSPDGKYVLSGGGSTLVYIWKAN